MNLRTYLVSSWHDHHTNRRVTYVDTLPCKDTLVKTKICVKELISDVGDYNLEGHLDNVIKDLQSLVKKLCPVVYKALYFQQEYAGHDGGYNYDLYGYRLENDAEYEQRQMYITEEKQHKADEKKKEQEKKRQLYEQLKKEFEK